MKFSEIANYLLDRGWTLDCYSVKFINARISGISTDGEESLWICIRSLPDKPLRCIVYDELVTETTILDREFHDLKTAIFAAMLAAVRYSQEIAEELALLLKR